MPTITKFEKDAGSADSSKISGEAIRDVGITSSNKTKLLKIVLLLFILVLVVIIIYLINVRKHGKHYTKFVMKTTLRKLRH